MVFGDINVVRLGSGRIEGDAERLVEAMGEGLDRSGMRRPIGGAHHADKAGRGLGQEHVAVRRDPQDARVVEALGEQIDAKPRGRRRNPVGGGDPRREGGCRTNGSRTAPAGRPR